MIFSMRIIRQTAFTATPWKNGGGITHEAIRVPASGDPFRWRVSVAHIDRSGPFSDFAAYQRTMVLLRGEGVILSFANGDERVLQQVGDTAQFDGGLAAQCVLTKGPCVDLNLMVAKSLHGARAWVARVKEPLPLPAIPGCSTLVFSMDAAVALHGDGDSAALEPWDLAVISHAAGQAGSLTPRAPFTAASVFLATVPH
jgi:environmental stress-induced protein Ves